VVPTRRRPHTDLTAVVYRHHRIIVNRNPYLPNISDNQSPAPDMRLLVTRRRSRSRSDRPSHAHARPPRLVGRAPARHYRDAVTADARRRFDQRRLTTPAGTAITTRCSTRVPSRAVHDMGKTAGGRRRSSQSLETRARPKRGDGGSVVRRLRSPQRIYPSWMCPY